MRLENILKVLFSQGLKSQFGIKYLAAIRSTMIPIKKNSVGEQTIFCMAKRDRGVENRLTGSHVGATRQLCA